MKETIDFSAQPAVAEALGKLSTVTKVAPGRWELSISNGKPLPVSVRMDGEWLLFESPLAKATHKLPPWKLLGINAELPGLAKLALSPRGKALQLRADLFLGPATAVPAQVAGAIADLTKAAARIHGESKAGREARSPSPSRAAALGQICEEAGWPFKERASGAIVVELEGGAGFYQAEIQPFETGALHASVDVADCSGFSDDCREALGVLLLGACGITRLARAAVLEEGASARARFEVRFERGPEVFEMKHALGALSVACREFGREARALGDEELARMYSEIQTNHRR
jgi:hypothetical protein